MEVKLGHLLLIASIIVTIWVDYNVYYVWKIFDVEDPEWWHVAVALYALFSVIALIILTIAIIIIVARRYWDHTIFKI